MLVALGVCYRDGDGVRADGEMSYKLIKQAADEGIKEGLFELGRCYEYGIGVTQNTTAALTYLRQAQQLGCEGAEDEISEIEKTKQSK